MPKYGIHFIVLQGAIERLKAAPAGSLAASRGAMLERHRFFANLGAIGPDLFFYAPDYPFINALLPFYSTYRDVTNAYDKLLAPLKNLEDQVEDAVDDTLDQLEQLPVVGTHLHDIRALVDQVEKLKNTFAAIKEDLFKVAIVRVLGLDARDPEYGALSRGLYQTLFESGSHAGFEEPDWYWFDMLHYRKSGEFGRRLLELAGRDQELQAYALAYLSHIATDLVGHPYVNQVVGTPYRWAVQRHVTVENYMDQWKWSAAFDGANIRATLYDAYGFDAVPDLPDKLADLLARALRATYGHIAHPLRLKSLTAGPATAQLEDGFLSAGAIKDTYRLLRDTMGLLGDNRDLRPEEPYDGADADLAQLNEDLGIFDPPPSLGPPPFPGCSSWDDIFGSPGSACFAQFAEDLRSWMAMLRETIDWALQTAGKALSLIEDMISTPQPGTPTRTLMLLVYACQLQVYAAYRALSSILAIGGLLYPEPDEARLTSPLAASLIAPRLCAADGSKSGFPRMRPAGQSHLICPDSTRGAPQSMREHLTRHGVAPCCELPLTLAAPYSTHNATPDVFITDATFDPAALRDYAAAASPAATRALQQAGRSIGNATDLTAFMIGGAGNPAARADQAAIFCNWNLDGDRGYGYKSWQAVTPLCEFDAVEIAFAHYSAEMARQYPRVWPDATAAFVPPEGAESYVEDKALINTFLASLNLSEAAVPQAFTRLEATAAEWRALVPARIRVTRPTRLQNVRLVNGVQTNHYAAVQESHQLRLTLAAAMAAQGVAGAPGVVLVHNRTGGFIPDVIEAVPDKMYAYALLAHLAGTGAGPPPAVANPTTIGIIALLHQAMERNTPLLLVGYSQGTLITGSAVLAFGALGASHAAYLQERVRLLHLAVVHYPAAQALLKTRVNAYLKYVNVGDPLTMLLSDPTNVVTNGDVQFADVAAAARLSPDAWFQLRGIADTASDGLVANLRVLRQNHGQQQLVDAHMMSRYLGILAADVQANAAVDGVNVRDFLFS